MSCSRLHGRLECGAADPPTLGDVMRPGNLSNSLLGDFLPGQCSACMRMYMRFAREKPRRSGGLELSIEVVEADDLHIPVLAGRMDLGSGLGAAE